MESGMVDRVRRFNRTVTQRIGALNDAFLSSDRSRKILLEKPFFQ
jgi:hypothetical protein